MMNKFMLTTAIVAVTSMGAVAQTTESDVTQSSENVPAFLATDFTGKSLYTLATDETRALTEGEMTQDQGTWERTSARWGSSDVFVSGRESWENVGNIDDIIMTMDGEIRGILIDVGGFLGIGARSVMVDIQDLYFVNDEANPEDINDFFIVATMTEEQLEALPEWSEEHLTMGFEHRGYQDANVGAGAAPEHDDGVAVQTDGTSDTDMQTQADARTEVPDGYQVMGAEERTADRLLGANVFGREGDNIATVDDLVLGDTGAVTHAIIDVGGFLGMGEHTVALEIDDIDVLWNDADGNVRVQLPMTQEELESLPEYES